MKVGEGLYCGEVKAGPDRTRADYTNCGIDNKNPRLYLPLFPFRFSTLLYKETSTKERATFRNGIWRRTSGNPTYSRNIVPGMNERIVNPIIVGLKQETLFQYRVIASYHALQLDSAKCSCCLTTPHLNGRIRKPVIQGFSRESLITKWVVIHRRRCFCSLAVSATLHTRYYDWTTEGVEFESR